MPVTGAPALLPLQVPQTPNPLLLGRFAGGLLVQDGGQRGVPAVPRRRRQRRRWRLRRRVQRRQQHRRGGWHQRPLPVLRCAAAAGRGYRGHGLADRGSASYWPDQHGLRCSWRLLPRAVVQQQPQQWRRHLGSSGSIHAAATATAAAGAHPRSAGSALRLGRPCDSANSGGSTAIIARCNGTARADIHAWGRQGQHAGVHQRRGAGLALWCAGKPPIGRHAWRW